jgi:protein-L-isoaspartate(D-aspartate) O-methyltransferase
VTAVEIDTALAARARDNLARYADVRIVEGDGGRVSTGARDAILINAGLTHPTDQWLESMTMGGRLVVPITMEVGVPHIGKGLVLCVSRLGSGYDARFLPMPVMIYSCTSARDAQLARAFGERFMSGTFDSVRSLRREQHSPEPSCWLHTAAFCLSTQVVA